ncbi:MAG: DUF2029 domain-containing protein [Candidatus Promineofilum sp.]|nr:DUF2029 domain-containing protein [Promineifilum sp.]
MTAARPNEPAAPRPWWPALLWLAVVAVAAVAYYRLVWGDVPTLVAALDHCKELYCDFTRQYYPTGRDVLTTGQPSNGYFYSSFFALLLVPFGRVELGTAIALWSLVQLVGIALLLLPAIDFYRESPRAFALYVVLLAFAMPLLHNLKWGQVSTLVTGGAFASLFLYRRGRVTAAAVVLGLAVAVKYYVAVVAFIFLLRRDWRFLAVLAATVLLLWLVIPTAVLGPEGNWQFYVTVRERVAHAMTTWMPEDINAQYLPSVAGRWLGSAAGRGVWRWLGYGLFAANLLAVARLVVRRAPRANEWAVALLFLGLPLAIETSWPHYFVYLPFAQTLVALETEFLLRNSVSTSSRSLVGWAAAVLLLLSIVLASMPFFHLVGRWQEYSQYGVLFVANLSLLIAAHLLTLRPAAQSGRPAPAASPAGAGR